MSIIMNSAPAIETILSINSFTVNIVHVMVASDGESGSLLLFFVFAIHVYELSICYVFETILRYLFFIDKKWCLCPLLCLQCLVPIVQFHCLMKASILEHTLDF